jgi:hypothetical protein
MYRIGLSRFSDDLEACPLMRLVPLLDVMGAASAIAAVAFLMSASGARATAPIYDPVSLNIGISCQWKQECQRRHMKALRSANKFIAAKHPPLWKIHLCNKNARRSPYRIDWIGFNVCIRNPNLSPPAAQRHR